MFKIIATTVIILFSWSAALTIYLMSTMALDLLLKHTPHLQITEYITHLGVGVLCAIPCLDYIKAGHRFARDMFPKQKEGEI